MTEQNTLNRYDKAIKDAKGRSKYLGHYLIVNEKEYKESTAIITLGISKS